MLTTGPPAIKAQEPIWRAWAWLPHSQEMLTHGQETVETAPEPPASSRRDSLTISPGHMVEWGGNTHFPGLDCQLFLAGEEPRLSAPEPAVRGAPASNPSPSPSSQPNTQKGTATSPCQLLSRREVTVPTQDRGSFWALCPIEINNLW